MILVSSDYRRKGLSSALLRAIIERLEGRNCIKLGATPSGTRRLPATLKCLGDAIAGKHCAFFVRLGGYACCVLKVKISFHEEFDNEFR